jgi:hypothetical protein
MFGNLKKTLYISCIRLRVKQLKHKQMKNSVKMSELVKKVITSGNKVEIENLKNQLRTQYVDVFGEEVSLYEIYENYFKNNQ